MLRKLIEMAVLQQTTTDPGKYQGMWGSGNWFDAIVMPFLDHLGPIFPLVVGLGIAGILAIYSGGMALPAVVMILVGGMLIQFLPAAAQSAALILMLLGIALALYTAWQSGGGRL